MYLLAVEDRQAPTIERCCHTPVSLYQRLAPCSAAGMKRADGQSVPNDSESNPQHVVPLLMRPITSPVVDTIDIGILSYGKALSAPPAVGRIRSYNLCPVVI